MQAGDEVIVYADLPAELPMQLFAGQHDPITAVDLAGQRPLLERAWARANIERLQARRSALHQHETTRRAELDREIVALSTKYRVLSELTAMLVLESEADYARFAIQRNALADILVVGHEGTTLMRRTSLPPLPDIGPASGRASMDDALRMANDEEDVWGSLTGTEIGEAFGTGGLGLVGAGRGGGGDGDAIIGLGNVGLIGHGHGSAGYGGRGGGPRVRQGKAEVKGAYSKDIVRRIVRAHINEIRYCYNQGLVRDATLRGRVVVQFTIGPAGGVAAAVVQSSTIGDTPVEQCTAKAVRRWKFPKPDAGSTILVTYPFLLESDGSGALVIPQPPATPPPPRSDETAAPNSPFADVTTALAEGRTGDALATTLAWRERDANDVMALVALGEVSKALGDRATAARAYGSIIDLHPARADLRRYAGALLESLGPGGQELALDTYTKALASRPDHPSSYRAVAFALVALGRYADAFVALDEALGDERIKWERFAGVQRLMREDLAIVGAAWLAKAPHDFPKIDATLDRHDVALANSPSTRFVLTWETDANDVDFHIRDAGGDHAFYGNRKLASGGELYADVTTGYGPECFAIQGTPTAGPYQLSAQYFSRGPMGFGMGNVQTLVHDGDGGVRIEGRPFVITTAGGTVDLGTHPGALRREDDAAR